MSRSKKSEERPLGVEILAVGACLIGGLMVLMSMGMNWSAFASVMLSGFESMGGLVVVVGLLYIVSGVGLWSTESWGWWTGMIMNGIAVLSSFSAPVFMVISLAVMVYLYSIRDLFEITF